MAAGTSKRQDKSTSTSSKTTPLSRSLARVPQHGYTKHPNFFTEANDRDALLFCPPLDGV
eukprot:3104532-Amphidinium_carterae.1